MSKIKIYGRGMTRIPKHIQELGFTPNSAAEVISNAITFTVIKPGATPEQVEHSLEITLDDLRLKLGKKRLREVLREP